MYLSGKAEDVYSKVQYELSDEQRFELYKRYTNKDCHDIGQFWDWWESLDNDEIEDAGDYIEKDCGLETKAISEYAVEGKFTVICGEGDVGEARNISIVLFNSEDKAMKFAKHEIEEISDVYGYNFVAVYDKDCEEIETLTK